MAKEQNLFLNPAKISGICGRLLCCLSYEQDTYDTFHNAAPKIGKRYTTDMGILKVVRTNMFKNTVAVLNEQGQEQEIDVDGWEGLHPVKTQGFDDCHEHDEQTAYGNYMSMEMMSISARIWIFPNFWMMNIKKSEVRTDITASLSPITGKKRNNLSAHLLTKAMNRSRYV